MTVILPVLTAIGCVISLLLMLKDFDEQRNLYVETGADAKENPAISRISMIYSAVCIVGTIVIAIVLADRYLEDNAWVGIKRMLLLTILWPLAYIDFKTYRIPNLFVILGLVWRAIVLIFELFLGNSHIWTTLLSEGLAAGALLLAAVLCALVIKNGIGFGDMKLFVVMGLFLGMNGVWSVVLLALIVSFFIAVFLLITKKKTRKDAIPFGPAIVIGTYLSICLSGM